MNVGAWLIAITHFLKRWRRERFLARVEKTLGEGALDEAVLTVGERARRDGWVVYPDPNIDLDRQPGAGLDPKYQYLFEEEVEKELLRRLRGLVS